MTNSQFVCRIQKILRLVGIITSLISRYYYFTVNKYNILKYFHFNFWRGTNVNTEQRVHVQIYTIVLDSIVSKTLLYEHWITF